MLTVYRMADMNHMLQVGYGGDVSAMLIAVA
jgi:hypothetical protein